ncbi:hypothetical protein DQ04_05381010 [Trypanosoma grayi]|uniref:hypothetical protein n=1 Tax=Trypanosoma grayi TaxID=71804 RepID=UPI0004F4B405|nr:hypothetical protein DQ04_05381010 [Trypanosoma grayi]KEG09338.1 hypothetical protein DQ04_05381010 [Trypanosoma grayi]
MGPKKGMKKAEEAALAVEDPLLLEAGTTAAGWTERGASNTKKIVAVQQVLGTLSAQVEECSKKLAGIYEDANLLSSLRILDYRQKMNPTPPTLPTKKQRSKRDSSAKVAGPPVDENSTEALVAAMDEKKRIRVTTALVNLFKRNNDNLPSPTPQQQPPQQSARVAAAVVTVSPPPPPSGTPLLSEAAGRQHFAPSLVSSEALSMTLSTDPRRPKDVPPELWEEVSKLRCARVVTEERLATLTKAIETQVARFDLLMLNHSIAAYATDAMEHTMQLLRQKKS